VPHKGDKVLAWKSFRKDCGMVSYSLMANEETEREKKQKEGERE